MKSWHWLIISVAAILIAGYLYRDLVLTRGQEVRCDDGPRQAIDPRQFATQYWAYSAEVEATLAKGMRLRTRLDPTTLHELSDALQQANEFRKWLVASYNACALTKTQYKSYAIRYQTLDNLARQIAELSKDQSLQEEDRSNFAQLVQRYITLSQELTQP